MIIWLCILPLFEFQKWGKKMKSWVGKMILFVHFPDGNGFFPFYVDYLLPVSPKLFVRDMSIWVTRRVFYKLYELLTLPEYLSSSPFCCGIRVIRSFTTRSCVRRLYRSLHAFVLQHFQDRLTPYYGKKQCIKWIMFLSWNRNRIGKFCHAKGYQRSTSTRYSS